MSSAWKIVDCSVDFKTGLQNVHFSGGSDRSFRPPGKRFLMRWSALEAADGSMPRYAPYTPRYFLFAGRSAAFHRRKKLSQNSRSVTSASARAENSLPR